MVKQLWSKVVAETAAAVVLFVVVSHSCSDAHSASSHIRLTGFIHVDGFAYLMQKKLTQQKKKRGQEFTCMLCICV